MQQSPGARASTYETAKFQGAVVVGGQFAVLPELRGVIVCPQIIGALAGDIKVEEALRARRKLPSVR
ncbi:MAG: hypothetical protein ACJA1F_001963 [Paracoccaceae bacterium]